MSITTTTPGAELCKELDKIINGHAIRHSPEARDCARKTIEVLQKHVKSVSDLEKIKQEIEDLSK